MSEAGARSRNPERFVRGILRYNSLLSGFRRYDAMSAPTPIWIISVALLMLACDRTEPPGNHWRVGGLYSTDDGTGQFSVVKILMLEPDVVHLRIYKEKFASRPTTVDPNSLTVGKLGDKQFSIGHLPLSSKSFASWKPIFISQQAVQDNELEGYRLWKEANGGVF